MAIEAYITQQTPSAEAAKLRQAWEGLVARGLVPAGYNAPDLMLPVLAQKPGAVVHTVTRGGRLALALPAETGRFYDASLSSPLVASGLPHVDAAYAETALRAFLNARAKPFLFKAVPAEGAFAEALQHAATRQKVLLAWRRAGLVLEGSFDAWLADNFDHKRRKELKRQRTRLAEQGELKLESLNQNSNLQSFVEDLLRLESAGWKGQRGTALGNNADLALSFAEAAQNLQAAGKLRFWRLVLNGKAIAALFAIVEGQEAWLGKIAYDEAFAKYSPGTSIIIDATEALFAEGGIARVDSSAIPGHPMIDRIWRDRIAFHDVLAAGEGVSPLGFALVAWGLLARQTIRAVVKRAFYMVSGRKRS